MVVSLSGIACETRTGYARAPNVPCTVSDRGSRASMCTSSASRRPPAARGRKLRARQMAGGGTIRETEIRPHMPIRGRRGLCLRETDPRFS